MSLLSLSLLVWGIVLFSCGGLLVISRVLENVGEKLFREED